MRRRAGALALLLLALALTASRASAIEASPSEILSDPDRFDGKIVTLSGTVTHLKSRVSQRGNAYSTFDLSDGRRAITVFAFGESPCANGRRARVEGLFQKVKRQGRYTFSHQVDATSTVC
ncbi:MAG: hypothetical protein AUH29_13025 [Candidatus Rokubacteria bacterium 13_1_40CM_69_27]|nr:MAG: hypothetical protein AUH29_13025 [Candidatus Rokubacteria bacterium 13_1_40CM_69_27]OLC30917.1 MAG: hypothetical protein AUH81_19140 [Candidatus Rokubacteria bacterium 13_1_40CM_4_69_5]